MEKWTEVIEKAGELYGGNFHCCEAILLAVGEYYGYPALSRELLLKISTPLGGGMINNGAACGSLLAAYLCMGIFKGRTSENEGRNSACEPADRIFQRFCRKYGSPNCREITGYDKKDPEAVKLYGSKVKCQVCIPLTQKVTRWILEELENSNENL